MKKDCKHIHATHGLKKRYSCHLHMIRMYYGSNFCERICEDYEENKPDYHDFIIEQEERTYRIMQKLNLPDEATAKNLHELKYKTDYPTSPEDRKSNMAERILRIEKNRGGM